MIPYYHPYQVLVSPVGIPACHTLPPPYQSGTTPSFPNRPPTGGSFHFEPNSQLPLSPWFYQDLDCLSKILSRHNVKATIDYYKYRASLGHKKGTVPLNILYGPTLSNMTATTTCSYLNLKY